MVAVEINSYGLVCLSSHVGFVGFLDVLTAGTVEANGPGQPVSRATHLNNIEQLHVLGISKAVASCQSSVGKRRAVGAFFRNDQINRFQITIIRT